MAVGSTRPQTIGETGPCQKRDPIHRASLQVSRPIDAPRLPRSGQCYPALPNAYAAAFSDGLGKSGYRLRSWENPGIVSKLNIAASSPGNSNRLMGLNEFFIRYPCGIPTMRLTGFERGATLAGHMSPAGLRRARFGVFDIDLAAREIRKHGTRIRLQGQPFDVLCALIERPGELVTREDLRGRLWPNDTFVDFDQSVNKAVNKLREALGDSASHPIYIETLARRGYRFLVPVEKEQSADSTVQTADAGCCTYYTPAADLGMAGSERGRARHRSRNRPVADRCTPGGESSATHPRWYRASFCWSLTGPKSPTATGSTSGQSQPREVSPRSSHYPFCRMTEPVS